MFVGNPAVLLPSHLNTLRLRQNGRHFADDVFKCIFLNENVWILLQISLKFIPKCPIKNIPSLVQIMAWRRPGDKSLSEPMMVSLLTHICVARPQWVIMFKNWNTNSWICLQDLIMICLIRYSNGLESGALRVWRGIPTSQGAINSSK